MSKWKKQIDSMLKQKSDIESGLVEPSFFNRTIGKRIEIHNERMQAIEVAKIRYKELIDSGVTLDADISEEFMDYRMKNNRRTV